MIAGLVLAAGRAARFGAPKLAAPLHGQAIVRHVLARLREAGLKDIVVVTGTDGAAIEAAIAEASVRTVANPTPGLGLSSSLRVGIAELPASVDAFVVALGDQPLIDPAVVRSLVTVWESSNAAAVVPVYRNGRGNPVLFDATLRSMLSALEGDSGARDLLDTLGDRVVRLTIDADAPRDVDTPEDLRLLERDDLRDQ